MPHVTAKPQPHLVDETPSPIAALVGTDGSPVSHAAIRVAEALLVAGRVDPQAIAVDPIELAATAGVAMAPDKAMAVWLGREHITAWRREVRADLKAAGGGNWPIRLCVGLPVPTIIAREVTNGHFGLVVLGLRHRGMAARLVRRDTVRRMVEHASVPVLAVASGLSALPRHAVVGIDFSDASEHAAEVAARLLAEDGTLTLAYVDLPPDPPSEMVEGHERLHREGCRALMDKLAARLSLPRGAHVEHVRLSGAIVPTLLEFAERTGSDLIAVGRQRASILDRAIGGSVSADLLHDGRCSILVTPSR